MDRICKPHTHCILPQVYDDSISYYEAICKLQKAVNQLAYDLYSGIQSSVTISYDDENTALIIKTYEEV